MATRYSRTLERASFWLSWTEPSDLREVNVRMSLERSYSSLNDRLKLSLP